MLERAQVAARCREKHVSLRCHYEFIAVMISASIGMTFGAGVPEILLRLLHKPLIALHIEEGFEGRALDLRFHEDFNCRIRHGALSHLSSNVSLSPRANGLSAVGFLIKLT
jgi:hypothetical protein